MSVSMEASRLWRSLARRLPSGSEIKASFSTIKGKIFLVFALTFFSIFALTMLNIWSLATVQGRLIFSERYDDLLNNILEVRRFEKNFLFYKDPGSLAEGTEYLRKIEALTASLAEDIAAISSKKDYQALTTRLSDYGRVLQALKEGKAPNPAEIRAHGKALLDMAERFRKIKRERIHLAIERTSLLPFAFLGVFLLLVILVIKVVSYGLLRPLDIVRTTTLRVARGDFSPILYEHGYLREIEGLLSAFNRMAQELENNQESLLQARKIAALGTFTAGIAHELNNPLNNISLSAETLLEEHGPELNEDAHELARDIIAQADRASDIVKNLLDFSRTERPAFKRLEPLDVARSIVSLVRNQIMLAGLRFKMEMPENLPAVQGDLRGLQQVFMNLLLNAIQATSSGGLITFSAAEDPMGYVRFDVRDTGVGIKSEALQHIFEPFFTTKEVGRGTGLGLAVAYSIVKRHGGRIEVSSEEGSGSVFTVFLPVAHPASAAETQTSQTEEQEHAG